MKNIKLSLLSLVFLSVFNQTFSQQDLTIYNMDNVQQSLYTNPAARLKYNVNIGLPVISSIYFNHLNNTFVPKALFEVNGDVPTLRVDYLKDEFWKKKNYLGFNAKVDLLSFGFRIKEKNYLSFNVTENIFSRITFPKDLLTFPFTGNAKFEENNGELNFEGFGMDAHHYREYGLGFQREINDKLTLGAKLKYLKGMANVHTDKSSITWTTDEETYDYEVKGEMALYTSGIPDTNQNYIAWMAKNSGLGLDLGATYKLNDKINLSASVIDFGFIRWKERNRNIVTNDAVFVYNGIDFSSVIFESDSASQTNIEQQADNYQTDFENQFNTNGNTDAYSTSLLTRFYLGGTYQIFKNDKFGGKAGALFHGELYHGRFRPSMTLSYTQDVGRWLQASLSYSNINRGSNLGAGLSLNLFPLQIYVVADNLLAANLAYFTDNTNSSEIPYPYNAKNVHIHAGINLTFGGKNKDKDKDGIKDRKDRCPEVPGLLEFGGCPDTDGDGIVDEEDKCPNIAGVKALNGCPDKDGDGITDAEDNCPEIAGIKEFNGCPDTDNDGIMDKEDECPELAGTKENNGCPDTDGDGLIDKNDNCPNDKGPKENNGCPWGDKDGDGILDNVDKCPTHAGPQENNGCPYLDTDKDGVLDKDDKCPNTPGIKENNGCPEIKKEEQEILNTAFDNLEFESGKDVIKQSSYKSLDELATLLSKKPDWRLKIEGHTDNSGNAQSNMLLSEKRAKAVATYLSSKGIDSNRLTTEWYGQTKPIADNSTPEGRQKNRRVEMTVIFE